MTEESLKEPSSDHKTSSFTPGMPKLGTTKLGSVNPQTAMVSPARNRADSMFLDDRLMTVSDLSSSIRTESDDLDDENSRQKPSHRA